MASRIRLSNNGASLLALDIKFDAQRQLHRFLQPNGGYVDVETICTIDELNRIKALGQLPSGVTVTVTDTGDDLAGIATDAENRLRSGFPILDFITDETLSIAGIPATHTITGRNLLNGQTRASLTVGTGTSSVLFEACRPGAYGNLLSIQMISGGAESISVTTPVGEVTSATTIAITYNNGTSTGNSIAILVNAHAQAKKLVYATGGGSGTSLAESGPTALDGGVGEGFKVYLGGLEQNVVGKVTDTSLPMLTRVFTSMANLDGASVYCVSDGTMSFPLNVRIVT